MWQVAKEALFLLLAFLDAEFTKRKLTDLGVEYELNPLIRKLSGMFGIQRGVDLGIVIPTFILGAIGWYLPEFLAFLIGVRAMLCVAQWKTQQVIDANRE